MKAYVEEILAPGQYSFLCRRFSESRFSHPYHYHPEIELTYVCKSSGMRIVGDHVGSFEEGDLCLIGSNLPHIYRNTIEPSSGAESEVLHLSEGCANGFMQAAPELRGFVELLAAAKLGLSFSPETGHEVGALLAQIRKSSGVRRWIHFFGLVECLLNAPAPQTLASPGYVGALNTNTSDRMSKVCQYILEHFDEDLSHEFLAKKMNVSPAYFSRIFKKTTRKTYTEFITEVRLGHTCRMLIESELPIIDIAFSSGFSNLSHFNRTFLKKYACTPREYRSQYGS